VSDAWQALLTGAEAQRARAVALDVGSRLVDGERLARALATSGETLDRAGAPARGWSVPGLSGADASVALLCGQLDRLEPGAGWDRAGHAHLAVAARAAERDSAGSSLYAGAAGVGYCAAALADGRPRYGALLASVDDALAVAVDDRLAALAAAPTLPVHAWDLISGITGIGTYLLSRGARPALERVLSALVALSGDGGGAPRWATATEHLFAYLRPGAPEGSVNCGVAHGVPGPLALMALALSSDVEVAGQVDAMRGTAAWLAAQARPGRWGPDWPAAVPLGPAANHEPPPARPGWCYGNAGIARALWLTGRALEEPEHRRLALSALRQALERQRVERPLDSPTLCHGVAGLAQVALRLTAESGQDDLRRATRALCLDLVERFEAGAPFGYRDVAIGAGGARVAVDDPTLLAGATGTALVLLAGATDKAPEWDRALLLA
jgi:lantibiotic biosynthesis protein